jgi:hypothetical protein
MGNEICGGIVDAMTPFGPQTVDKPKSANGCLSYSTQILRLSANSV